MKEIGYVYCKGKWTQCETSHFLKHNYREVKVLASCCFEHEIYTRLLTPPTLWAKERPKTTGHPLLSLEVMSEVLSPHSYHKEAAE